AVEGRGCPSGKLPLVGRHMRHEQTATEFRPPRFESVTLWFIDAPPPGTADDRLRNLDTRFLIARVARSTTLLHEDSLLRARLAATSRALLFQRLRRDGVRLGGEALA